MTYGIKKFRKLSQILTFSLKSYFYSILHYEKKLIFMAKNFIKNVFDPTSHSYENKKIKKDGPSGA
jgi:hypothetical protein